MSQAKDINVITTDAFKLKDKPTRFYQAINLKKQFGFQPEVILVEKVRGRNNTLIVRAVVPEAELQKHPEYGRESIRATDKPSTK